MEYAIKQLEEAETVLKETIDGLAEFEVNTQELRESLLEVQTAIILLQANTEIMSLAKAQVLRTLQK